MRDPNHVLPPGNGTQPAIATPRRHLDFGSFALDLDGRILIDPSGREVELRRREFDLLLTLARSPGRVMSRETLLDAIAGREAEAFDRTIDVYVGRLRRKIEADPKQPRLIVTVPGVGYRLAAKPRTREPPVGCVHHIRMRRQFTPRLVLSNTSIRRTWNVTPGQYPLYMPKTRP